MPDCESDEISGISSFLRETYEDIDELLIGWHNHLRRFLLSTERVFDL